MKVNDKRVAVVVNPVSRSGRTGKHWPKYEAALRKSLDNFSVFMTAHQGHATKLTKQALNDGYDHVASVGGDGTHHEVLNGFFDGYLPINPTASMSIIPHGTGSDLARTLNLNTPFEGIDLMTNGQFQKVDIGRASFTHFNGTPGVQYFLNVADFGIGGMVVERVQRGKLQSHGKLGYLWSIIVSLFAYQSPEMRIQIDGEVLEQKTLNVIMAKGEYYGGGIHVARHARLNSGKFEVIIINDIKFMRALRYLPRFYDGTFIEIEELVLRRKAARIVAESDARVLINLDGEAPGQLPLAVEILPSALNLLVPKDYEG